MLPVAMTSLFILRNKRACSARYGTGSEVLEMFPVWGAHARIIRLSITCQLVGRGSSTLQRPRAE